MSVLLLLFLFFLLFSRSVLRMGSCADWRQSNCSSFRHQTPPNELSSTLSRESNERREDTPKRYGRSPHYGTFSVYESSHCYLSKPVQFFEKKTLHHQPTTTTTTRHRKTTTTCLAKSSSCKIRCIQTYGSAISSYEHTRHTLRNITYISTHARARTPLSIIIQVCKHFHHSLFESVLRTVSKTTLHLISKLAFSFLFSLP